MMINLKSESKFTETENIIYTHTTTPEPIGRREAVATKTGCTKSVPRHD